MKNACILVIEDSLDDIDMTLRVFRKCGIAMNVMVVRDGCEAMNYLNGPPSSPDAADASLPTLIFLDIHMPRMDGFDVLRAIRDNDNTRHIPVVLLTSSDAEEDITAGYDLGANGYIQKPIDPDSFVKTLSRLGLQGRFAEEVPRA